LVDLPGVNRLGYKGVKASVEVSLSLMNHGRCRDCYQLLISGLAALLLSAALLNIAIFAHSNMSLLPAAGRDDPYIEYYGKR
jgi:hypothetical protein